MGQTRIVVRLNQQQRELLDTTVADQQAGDRGALIARALDEYHAEHEANGAR